MILTKYDKFALLPKRCNKCNSLFWLEPYNVFYRSLPTSPELEFCKCSRCVSNELETVKEPPMPPKKVKDDNIKPKTRLLTFRYRRMLELAYLNWVNDKNKELAKSGRRYRIDDEDRMSMITFLYAEGFLNTDKVVNYLYELDHKKDNSSSMSSHITFNNLNPVTVVPTANGDWKLSDEADSNITYSDRTERLN